MNNKYQRCKNKKVTAPEVPVQEQYIGKCVYCNKINEFTLLTKIDDIPKYCMNCGEPIIYQRNHAV